MWWNAVSPHVLFDFDKTRLKVCDARPCCALFLKMQMQFVPKPESYIIGVVDMYIWNIYIYGSFGALNSVNLSILFKRCTCRFYRASAYRAEYCFSQPTCVVSCRVGIVCKADACVQARAITTEVHPRFPHQPTLSRQVHILTLTALCTRYGKQSLSLGCSIRALEVTRSSAHADKTARRVWRSVKVTKHGTNRYVRYGFISSSSLSSSLFQAAGPVS